MQSMVFIIMNGFRNDCQSNGLSLLKISLTLFMPFLVCSTKIFSGMDTVPEKM